MKDFKNEFDEKSEKREYYKKQAIKYGLKGEAVYDFLRAIGYPDPQDKRTFIERWLFK